MQLPDSQPILVEVDLLRSVHPHIALPPGPGVLGQRDERARDQGKLLLGRESGRSSGVEAACGGGPEW